MKFAFVAFASRAPQQYFHVNATGQCDLSILNLLLPLLGDCHQSLPLEVVCVQLLLQLGQMHVEDRAVGYALVEVEAEMIAIFEARYGREFTI